MANAAPTPASRARAGCWMAAAPVNCPEAGVVEVPERVAGDPAALLVTMVVGPTDDGVGAEKVILLEAAEAAEVAGGIEHA